MTGKRLLAIAFVALILAASFGAAMADVIKTVVLTVPELCASNMYTASEALEALDGVDSVELDVDHTRITVRYVEYEVGVEDFKRAIAGIGLEVTEAVEGE